MFGWEFPPHISGGLGTACFGLTQALVQEGAEILFVVPRAYGDEALRLINASEVLISEVDKTVLIPASISNLTQTGMEVINIPSSLMPYCSLNQTSDEYSIEHWSYEIATTTSGVSKIEKGKAKKYKFTGSYGPQLLEEVERYSEVARALASQHSFDVIHAHDWLTYRAGIAAKEASGKPLIVHVHATEFDRAATIDKRVFAIECEGLQKADRIVAVSNWTKQILITNYHIAEEKISVVHNGMIARKPTPSFKPRMSNQIVTFLGRITYQKGPHYFIEAAQKVLTKFPNAHFVVAGSGDLLPAMLEHAAQLQVSSRFHFTGFLKAEEVEQIWAISDLYVMPSVSEPFGIAPLEAIQAGVPVIISKQSGVAEVMPHAIQLDFWDVDSLANAICSVLKHKSLSQTLRKKSKKSLQLLTWHVASKKIKTLYHELVNQH